MITERKIIEKIQAKAAVEQGNLVKGIGDDCAVIRQSDGSLTLLTVDTLVEGVHFDPAWHPPFLLGRKAANVNISDVAAMGGRPTFALLSLALTDSTDETWLDGFMAGFHQALGEHGVSLIGGDTVRAERIMLSITLLGETEISRILYRSGAAVGDVVLVSRFTGEAAAGLSLCRAGVLERWPHLMQAHLDPTPEVALGRLLAESSLVSAMMDSSDGVATDLAHLASASGLGAEIDLAALPVSPATKEAADFLKIDILPLALAGGEDYSLIFTVPLKNISALESLVQEKLGRPVYRIGRLVEGSGVTLCGDGQQRDISFQGFDHFGS